MWCVVVAWLVVGTVACSAGGTADAGPEAGSDASVDANADAGLDASVDAASDAPADALADSDVDASVVYTSWTDCGWDHPTCTCPAWMNCDAVAGGTSEPLGSSQARVCAADATTCTYVVFTET